MIVEIATLVTDDNLEIVAEGPTRWCTSRARRWTPWSTWCATCTPAGLLPAIQASEISLEKAARPRSTSSAPTCRPRTVPLCGNSIGTDRRFYAYLPDIENFLHYRSVDVSTIKELALRWAPDVVEAAPARRPPTGRWTISGRA